MLPLLLLALLLLVPVWGVLLLRVLLDAPTRDEAAWRRLWHADRRVAPFSELLDLLQLKLLLPLSDLLLQLQGLLLFQLMGLLLMILDADALQLRLKLASHLPLLLQLDLALLLVLLLFLLLAQLTQMTLQLPSAPLGRIEGLSRYCSASS